MISVFERTASPIDPRVTRRLTVCVPLFSVIPHQQVELSYIRWNLSTVFLSALTGLCQWKRDVRQFFFKRIAFKEQPKISSYRRCGKKEKKCLVFPFSPPTNGCRRRNLFFLVANYCQHAGRNQLVGRSTLDLNIDSSHGQPAWCPARRTNIDDGLEVIRWIRGLGGEGLPAASYGIPANLKKNYFLPFETEREVLSSVYTSGQLFFTIRLVSSRHNVTPAME